MSPSWNRSAVTDTTFCRLARCRISNCPSDQAPWMTSAKRRYSVKIFKFFSSKSLLCIWINECICNLHNSCREVLKRKVYAAARRRPAVLWPKRLSCRLITAACRMT